MNQKLFNPAYAVIGCGAVLALALLSGGFNAPPQATADATVRILPASAPAIGTEAAQAIDEPVAVPKRRNARASLSMPYFSFAQSLRPRG